MSLDPEPAQHFCAVPHLARRRIEDQVVVLDLRSSRIYGLNPSGGEVLEALQNPLTVGQIAERFIAAETEAPSVPGELSQFIESLAALGLVDRCPPPLEVTRLASVSDLATPWTTPGLLWQEEVARVTHQVSPPQQIGNPACLP